MATNFFVKTDKVGIITQTIRGLIKKEVLVGVPSDRSERKEGEPINNAEIGYINEFGAPEANIPPRPHVIPGIKSATDKIADALKAGVVGSLRGDKDAGMAALVKAGIIGESAIKAKITEGLMPPLSPKTIEARHHRRGTRMRKGEADYFKMLGEGKTPGEAQMATGIKALIDTGEYRRSITYVVRPKGK